MATVQMQISERGVRQFGAALVFLSKNGKDVTLEATADGVVLRTLNDAKNAFAAVHFRRGTYTGTWAPYAPQHAVLALLTEFFDDFRPPDVTQKSKFMAKVGALVIVGCGWVEHHPCRCRPSGPRISAPSKPSARSKESSHSASTLPSKTTRTSLCFSSRSSTVRSTAALASATRSGVELPPLTPRRRHAHAFNAV